MITDHLLFLFVEISALVYNETNRRLLKRRYVKVNIHEFGKENKEVILLVHPSVVKWDYFENVIPLLEKKYHLVIPALPGYDFEDDSDFSSVEQIANELNYIIRARRFLYGLSL